MSCHVMSFHVMSCHVMSCHVMSCHVMSCHLNLQFQSHWSFLNGTWQKRPKELDHQLCVCVCVCVYVCVCMRFENGLVPHKHPVCACACVCVCVCVCVWQKRPKGLDHQLRFENEEMPLHMQQAVYHLEQKESLLEYHLY